jgi:hypothetical protein
MTDKEAMAMALDALETEVSIDWTNNDEFNASAEKMHEAIAALKARLAQPEQEPVPTLEDLEQEIYQNTRNFISRDVMEWMLRRYYTHPPQRTWVGLTDEEILSDDTLRYYYGMNGGAGPVSQKGKKVIAAIEAKLKQKNGYAEEKNT